MKNNWNTVAEELYGINEQIKELTSQKKDLTDTLKKLSNYQTAFSGDYLFECTKRSGRIDYSAIPELLNVDLDKYRKKDEEYWSLKKISLSNKIVETL